MQVIRPGFAEATHDLGDGNAADGSHNTFFQVSPTLRVYARFPFHSMMNTEDVLGQLKLKPHTCLNLRADVHHLRLSKNNDLWYSGGGAFQEGRFGFTSRTSGGRRSLGTLFDVSVDVAVTSTTTFTIYGAGVRGGGVQSFI